MLPKRFFMSVKWVSFDSLKFTPIGSWEVSPIVEGEQVSTTSNNSRNINISGQTTMSMNIYNSLPLAYCSIGWYLFPFTGSEIFLVETKKWERQKDRRRPFTLLPWCPNYWSMVLIHSASQWEPLWIKKKIESWPKDAQLKVFKNCDIFNIFSIFSLLSLINPFSPFIWCCLFRLFSLSSQLFLVKFQY